MQEFGRRFIFVILLLPEILFAMFARRKKASPRGEAGALATDEGGSISTHATLTKPPASPPHEPQKGRQRRTSSCGK